MWCRTSPFSLFLDWTLATSEPGGHRASFLVKARLAWVVRTTGWTWPYGNRECVGVCTVLANVVTLLARSRAV